MNSPLCNPFPTLSQIPNSFQIRSAQHQTEYLINGEILHWQGEQEKVFSPICLNENNKIEQFVLGSYPKLTEKESMAALKAATEAFDHGRGLWPTMSIAERITHVQEFLIRMNSQKEEIVNLLMWEIGKSHADSVKEFDRTILYVKETIEALKNLDRDSSRFTLKQSTLAQIRRSPLGVVLCMGPFNYPLNETFTTLLPALIMGNSVIFKPPKLGVLLHRPLLKAFAESFPKGVINTVYGDGEKVITPLMKSGGIHCLAFIGSSRVADILKKQHPMPHRLKCVLGLDAKNPGIILPCADLDVAAEECVTGSLSYNGQRCTALKILFVHQTVYLEFIAKLVEQVEKLRKGMPWDEKVQITPLPEPNKVQYLDSLVADALKHGAKILNPSGGQSAHTLYQPTVLSPVNSSMRIYHEEQFGPIVPIVPFTSMDEPIQYMIDSKYGQQVSLFGQNPAELARLIDPLVNQVCRVNVNSQCQRGPDEYPFTGRKDSAEGTLSISDALKVFSVRTLVAAKENEANRDIINDIVRNHRSKFLSTDYIL